MKGENSGRSMAGRFASGSANLGLKYVIYHKIFYKNIIALLEDNFKTMTLLSKLQKGVM